jgi:hypothetical protein
MEEDILGILSAIDEPNWQESTDLLREFQGKQKNWLGFNFPIFIS